MPLNRSDHYHDLDLHANQLLNSRVHNITTANRTILGATLGLSDKGYQVYDTDLSVPYFWNGTAWQSAGGGSQNLQQVVNIGNGISNFGGIGNASIQSTNFTNGRTLYLNDNSYPTIRLVDNNNASNYLQIDLDTLNIDGVSYNWSSIVSGGLPSQATHAGQWLTTDGSAASWAALPIPTLQQVVTAGDTATDKTITVTATGSSTFVRLYDNQVMVWDTGVGNSQCFLETNGLTINNAGAGSYFNIDSSGANPTMGVNSAAFTFPNANGKFAISVNGITPNAAGNITVPVGTGTVTNVGAGTGMNFTAITTSGNVAIDTAKVPYYASAPSNGLLKYTSGTWGVDTNTYLTSAITSLGGLTGATQTFVDDTNVTMVSLGTTHTLTWSGTLADSRIASATTWNGKQSQLNGTGFVKASGTTISYDNSTYLTSAVTSIATSGLISGGTITTTGTISTSMNTNKLVGRSTAGVGEMEEITVGTGLSLSAGTLNSTAAGILHGTASGTDTYTVTIAGATAYADGDAYLIRFPNGNTGTATLNISGFGAVGLYRNNDGPIIGGDIWNGAEMLCIYNSTTAGFQLIGTSPNAMYAYVTNDDSVTITKGQVVYAFGGQGDRMTVKLANNTGDATSAQTVGVVLSATIAANQKGVIITQGLLNGLSILPTATYNDGDPLYLGATAGSITNVKPYAPNHLVYLGNVTTASNGAAGRWYVRIQNGYELDELHNVQARTPTLKDTLWYDNTVSPAQWKTASIPTILGYTPIQRSVNVVSTATAAGSTAGTDYVYLVSGTTTITLPAASGNTNLYTIKRVGTNTVSIATTAGTIDGSASPITINVQYVSLTLVSDGTNWNII